MIKKFLMTLALTGSALLAFADETPQYPGGEKALQKYLSENLKYPATAMEMGIEGVVAVGFMVMTDGSLQEIKVIRLVDPDLEKEAVRLVEGMPTWIPAEKDGTPIEAPSKVDISFILE